MKRKLSICILITALVALMATPIFAAVEISKPVTTTEVEVYDDGITAKATAVSTNYNTYVSGWSLSSRHSSKSGSKVTATGNFKFKTMTKSTTIGLKCSSSGTISAA